MESLKKMFDVSPYVQEGKDTECSPTDFIQDRKEAGVFYGTLKKLTLVRNKNKDTEYATKIIRKQKIVDLSIIQYFKTVLKNMYSIKHPNFPVLLTHFETDENLIMVFKKIENSQLTILRQLKDKELEYKLYIMKQIVNAMLYLKKRNPRIINREIASDTLLIDEIEDFVKITDYGYSEINRIANNKKIEVNAYTSPQEIQGLVIDEKNDIWKLGVLFFEILLKKKPFMGKNESELKENILKSGISFAKLNFPNKISQFLIKKMLSLNPADRPSLEEILNDALFVDIRLPSYLDTNNEYPEEEFIFNKIRIKEVIKDSSHSQLDVERLKTENAELLSLVEELKYQNNLLVNENKEFSEKITKQTAIFTNDTSLINIDDTMVKFNYLHDERISKKEEIERKSKEIVELKSQLRIQEAEIDLLNLNIELEKNKTEQYRNEISSLNQMIIELKNDWERQSASNYSKYVELKESVFDRTITDHNSLEEVCKKYTLTLLDEITQFKLITDSILCKDQENTENLKLFLSEILTEKKKQMMLLITDTKDYFNEVENRIKTRENFFSFKLSQFEKEIYAFQRVEHDLSVLNAENKSLKEQICILKENVSISSIEKSTIQSILNIKELNMKDLTEKCEDLENRLRDCGRYIEKYVPVNIAKEFRQSLNVTW